MPEASVANRCGEQGAGEHAQRRGKEDQPGQLAGNLPQLSQILPNHPEHGGQLQDQQHAGGDRQHTHAGSEDLPKVV